MRHACRGWPGRRRWMGQFVVGGVAALFREHGLSERVNSTMKRSYALFLFAVLLLPAALAHAAASITLGTLSLAADGKTLTATLGGGTAPYSISSAAGLTLAKTDTGGVTYVVNGTPTISGTTLTIVSSFPFSSMDHPTLAVASSNTITDSAGNTGETMAATAVTNNSTEVVSSFASTNSAIKQLGCFSTNTASGHNILQQQWLGSGVEFTATGTDIAVIGNASSATADIRTVDGAATQGAYSNVSASWAAIPLGSGLSNAAHACTFRRTLGSTWIDAGTSSGNTAGTVLVAGPSGSTPTIAAPSGSWGQAYVFSQAPFSTYGQIDGNAGATATGVSGCTAYSQGGGYGYRFYSSTSFIALFASCSNTTPQQYALYQDGVQIGSTVSANQASTSYGGTGITGSTIGNDRLVIATGLSGNHLYEVVVVNPSGTSGWQSPNNEGTSSDVYVELDTGSLTATAVPARTLEASYGDSIVENVDLAAAYGDDGRSGDAWQLGKALGSLRGSGVAWLSHGYGGKEVYNFLSTATYTNALPTSVTRVWEQGGLNDQAFSVTPGTPTTANTFASACVTMYQNLRARIGSGKWIIAMGIEYGNGQSATGSALSPYNSAKQAAVTYYSSTYSDPNILYVPRSTWIGPDSPGGTTADFQDGATHPDPQGYTKRFNRTLPIAAGANYGGPAGGTSYTIGLSSPTIARGNSVTITATSLPGICWYSDQTVKVTPSNGDPPLMIGFSNGSTTGLVTYTPSTAGTITITPSTASCTSMQGTNGAGSTVDTWSDPGAMTLTVTGSVAGARRPGSSAGSRHPHWSSRAPDEWRSLK